MKQFLGTILVSIFSVLSFSSYSQSPSVTHSKFMVKGTCAMCKQRIEKSLKIKGIETASWDVLSQTLSLTYDSTIINESSIHEKVASLGHDTEKKIATDESYNALPDCCRYRELNAETVATSEMNHNHINGVILSEDLKGNFVPLQGATVRWLFSKKTVTSDVHGVFSIPYEADDSLVISYTGFRPDTISITEMNDLQVILAANNQLNTVKVISRLRSTYINASSPFRVTTITSRELLKAACCNLSESFETNPSVDVSYNDAVTGSKQIQLLGLSGNYSQLTVENLPGPRGLATAQGLNTIAGPWIESIQLSKGTGSVVNGFESIAGQINVELKKPENTDKLFLNGYINSMGKTDLNLNWAKRIGSKWSTALLLHDNFLYTKTDFNKDGFRDLPTGNLFSAVNRWKYDDNKGLSAQFGVKVLNDNKTGGEIGYETSDKYTTTYYGLGMKTSRYEGFAKIGYVFAGKKYQSIGLQLAAFDHRQDAYFGLTDYNAKQSDFYSNLIYQGIINNTTHKFRTGLSLSADRYHELYKGQTYSREEVVPGGFFEYTYTPRENFNIVAGIRADHNNLYGWFATPRLNVRYEPVSGTTIRLSAGRGQRTANIFAENMAALVSARNVVIIPSETGKAYGLQPEVAWNKGISLDQKFRLFNRDAMFSVDFFRNDFTNQVVADMEDPRQLKFYNLDGKSYSNSFQGELSLIPLERFDIRMAYRWFDVKTTYGNQLMQKPFTAEHRAFTNLAYEIKAWKFDYTLNYTGRKRIPSTSSNLPQYRLGDYSPDYFTMNAQISRSIGKEKKLELYVGGENLTNVFQQRAILAADEPFGRHFDASMIWGPVSGRLVYGGFRYKLP
jgi:copper chaperone CopZ